MHHGAGVLITNTERRLFLLQQKNEGYRPHPYGFSFFGGAVEGEEMPDEAAFREVCEELGADAGKLVCSEGNEGATEIFAGLIHTKTPFWLTIFEIALKSEDFEAIAKMEVQEGRTSVVVDRELLKNLKMIWGIEIALKDYLSRLQ